MRSKTEIKRELTRNNKDQVFFNISEVCRWCNRSNTYKMAKKLSLAGVPRNASKEYFIDDLTDYFYQLQKV